MDASRAVINVVYEATDAELVSELTETEKAPKTRSAPLWMVALVGLQFLTIIGLAVALGLGSVAAAPACSDPAPGVAATVGEAPAIECAVCPACPVSSTSTSTTTSTSTSTSTATTTTSTSTSTTTSTTTSTSTIPVVLSKIDLSTVPMTQSAYWGGSDKVRDGITRGRWQEVAHVSNDRTTADLFFTFDLGSAKVVNGIAAYPCNNLGGWFSNCPAGDGVADIEVCGSDDPAAPCAHSLGTFSLYQDWFTVDGGDCPESTFRETGTWIGRKSTGTKPTCTAGSPGPCARCGDLFYQGNYAASPSNYYDDPVAFVTPAASDELQSYPQAKALAMTANGYRYYTVYYRQNYKGQPTNGGQCGGGWGAHKCMAEIEIYES